MTTHVAHPGAHVSTKTMVAAAAAAVIAVGAGFGIATLVIDEAVPAVTSQSSSDTVGGNPGMGFSDPNGFAGTDREARAFQHRR
jgi:hypothetical protein